MEAILIHLLVAVIVLGIVAGVIKLLERAGVLTAWMSQAAMLVIGGVFLIFLIVDVLIPLIHGSPGIG